MREERWWDRRHCNFYAEHKRVYVPGGEGVIGVFQMRRFGRLENPSDDLVGEVRRYVFASLAPERPSKTGPRTSYHFFRCDHGGSITCNNENASQSLQRPLNRGNAALMYGFCRTLEMFPCHLWGISL